MRASLLSEESDLQRATEQLDRLLDELGVVRFDAEAMVYPDPLIHAVVGERSDPSAPDGVVLETLDPGLRAGRGSILARARVVVNRRP
jgi:molecular chaperone GrpE (heat shock protein)